MSFFCCTSGKKKKRFNSQEQQQAHQKIEQPTRVIHQQEVPSEKPLKEQYVLSSAVNPKSDESVQQSTIATYIVAQQTQNTPDYSQVSQTTSTSREKVFDLIKPMVDKILTATSVAIKLDMYQQVKEEQLFMTQLIDSSSKLDYILEIKWALEYTQYLNKPQRRMRPIDNTLLLSNNESVSMKDSLILTNQNPYLLKKRLVAEKDYVFLNHHAWIFIRQLYGGGPEIKNEGNQNEDQSSKSINSSRIKQDQNIQPRDIPIQPQQQDTNQEYTLIKQSQSSQKPPIQKNQVSTEKQDIQKPQSRFLSRGKGEPKYADESSRTDNAIGQQYVQENNPGMQRYIEKQEILQKEKELKQQEKVTNERDQREAQEMKLREQYEREKPKNQEVLLETRQNQSIPIQVEVNKAKSSSVPPVKNQSKETPLNNFQVEKVNIKEIVPMIPPPTKSFGIVQLCDIPAQELPIVGLKNERFYCYMNSSLQCLMSIPQLNGFYFSGEITKLQGTKKKKYTPIYFDFLNTIQTKAQGNFPVISAVGLQKLTDRIFSYYEQHDSHEFLLHLLNELQEEVYVKRKLPESKTAQEALNLYFTAHNNLIDQIFAGQLTSQIFCPKCKEYSLQFDPIFDLSLPMKQSLTSSECTLDDCLKLYFKEEKIDDTWKCEMCKKTSSQVKRTLQISHTPNILIIQLKRFSTFPRKEKIKDSIVYQEVINLRQFCTSDVTQTKYKLKSMIIHQGSINGGHYISYGKRKGNWYCFNDENVDKVSDSEALKQKQAYVLFYEKLPQ